MGQSACQERNGLSQGRPAQADAAPVICRHGKNQASAPPPRAPIGASGPAPRPTNLHKYYSGTSISSFLAQYSCD